MVTRWFHQDIEGSGLFTDVQTRLISRHVELSTRQYLRMIQTFSPFRAKPADRRARTLEAVGSAVDSFGGTIVLDLRTTLVLARRPG
jgi:hypothetical protein